MDGALEMGDPKTAGLSEDGLKRVDQLLSRYVSDKVLPGAVWLLARGGKIVHQSALGFKNLQSGEPLTLETIFRLYSMTKPVTAVAMMVLYERGLWSPDDPISKHLPDFLTLKGPKEEPLDHPPTMLELMTHTAGFGYGIGPGPHDRVDAAYIDAGVWTSRSLAQMVSRIASVPLAYQPGARWRYSLSMDLQGAIIEKLSGLSLPEFMRAEIFEPLGMGDTDFFVPADRLHRLATVYHMYGVSQLTELNSPAFVRDPRIIPKLASGGGGLYSTISDYARFAQMLLNKGELDGRRVLTPASVELMTSNHLSEALLNGGFVAGVHAIRPGYGYGFNGAVFSDPIKAGSPVGSGSYQWDGAAGTWFWIDPTHQIVFVGLIQRMLQEGMPRLQEQTQALVYPALL